MKATICFKCGTNQVAVEEDNKRTLGLCPCFEGWFVGTVSQLCDYLNEQHGLLESHGIVDESFPILDEFNPDEDDEDDIFREGLY